MVSKLVVKAVAESMGVGTQVRCCWQGLGWTWCAEQRRAGGGQAGAAQQPLSEPGCDLSKLVDALATKATKPRSFLSQLFVISCSCWTLA